MPVSRSSVDVARSLGSVLEQTFGNVEILVSDDAGYGREAVKQACDPRVRYQHNSSPLGFIDNHKALLAQARGALIAFLHDDDHWEPNYLEEAVLRLEASPDAGFVLTAHRETPGGSASPYPQAGCYANALPILLDERVRLLPSATVMRRTILADVRNRWPPLSCGDMVLYLDAASAGWGVAVIDVPLVTYTRHPGQISAKDTQFREDLAQLLELYRFKDPTAERLRRHRLAMTRLSIARAHLKTGHPAKARASVAHARTAERSVRTQVEGMALLALGQRPSLLRATIRAWYAIRGVPPTMDKSRA